ncbi:uncharacterized protein LOC141725287 isoform X4 [Zonotrichia albicollis]|uniref:uncharacterized protein LOC141725287 isoform X4 n=1 Tax=Zonotrichia albicollis TaxID=44394 RepID=UPI003D80E18B
MAQAGLGTLGSHPVPPGSLPTTSEQLLWGLNCCLLPWCCKPSACFPWCSPSAPHPHQSFTSPPSAPHQSFQFSSPVLHQSSQCPTLESPGTIPAKHRAPVCFPHSPWSFTVSCRLLVLLSPPHPSGKGRGPPAPPGAARCSSCNWDRPSSQKSTALHLPPPPPQNSSCHPLQPCTFLLLPRAHPLTHSQPCTFLLLLPRAHPVTHHSPAPSSSSSPELIPSPTTALPWFLPAAPPGLAPPGAAPAWCGAAAALCPLPHHSSLHKEHNSRCLFTLLGLFPEASCPGGWWCLCGGCAARPWLGLAEYEGFVCVCVFSTLVCSCK